ncbi:MAG: type II secretion system F family protein, partial [Clostridia bacterium]|nr:type II secretion system F family protein [Clostridia bacterium]
MNKTVGGLNKRKLDDIELSLLCHQLAQAFKSGIHPLEAVTLITEETPSTIIRSSLKAAAESMAEGASLYEALDEAGCYPQYMLRMLDIGEKSGSLEAVLEKLSVYYENAADLKKRIRCAVLYPLILGALMLGVIALLILKIIPMFRDIIESLGGEIPTEAQALFSFTIHVKTILLVLIVVICILAAVVFMVSKTAKGKAYFDGLKINNPLTGKTYRKMITSHLSLGLGLTLKSGLPVVECLQSLKGLIPNTYVDNKLAMAGEAVLKGESLEASL